MTKQEIKKYQSDYPIPGVTVDVCVVVRTSYSTEILLIERGADPFKGSLALPGGFLNNNENIIQGALRELKEETTISNVDLPFFTFVGVYSEPGRDPRGWTISNLFVYDVQGSYRPNVKASDDAVNHEWVSFDSIKLGVTKLAFDHKQMVMDAMAKLSVK